MKECKQEYDDISALLTPSKVWVDNFHARTTQLMQSWQWSRDSYPTKSANLAYKIREAKTSVTYRYKKHKKAAEFLSTVPQLQLQLSACAPWSYESSIKEHQATWDPVHQANIDRLTPSYQLAERQLGMINAVVRNIEDLKALSDSAFNTSCLRFFPEAKQIGGYLRELTSLQLLLYWNHIDGLYEQQDSNYLHIPNYLRSIILGYLYTANISNLKEGLKIEVIPEEPQEATKKLAC